MQTPRGGSTIPLMGKKVSAKGLGIRRLMLSIKVEGLKGTLRI